MRNKTVAIILAIVALVVVGVFVVKPMLIGKQEEQLCLCTESGKEYKVMVTVGSEGPFMNPDSKKMTLRPAYLAKWQGKDGKVNEKVIIRGTEEEHGITSTNQVFDKPEEKKPEEKKPEEKK
jgi:hypothetical protein